MAMNNVNQNLVILIALVCLILVDIGETTHAVGPALQFTKTASSKHLDHHQDALKSGHHDDHSTAVHHGDEDNMEGVPMLTEFQIQNMMDRCFPSASMYRHKATFLKYQAPSLTNNRKSAVDVNWKLPTSTNVISRLTPVAMAAVDMFNVISILSAQISLGTLTTVSVALGPIGYAMGVLIYLTGSVFLQKPAALIGSEAMQKMLDEVNWRFDIIESKLDSLELAVERTVMYTSYKDNQDKIRDVMHKLRAFLKYRSRITLQELQETCRYKDPHLSLAWIHRHVVYEAVGAELVTTVLKDSQYDKDKFQVWIQNILKDAYQAAFLRETCLGVRFGGFGEDADKVKYAPNSNRTRDIDLICAASLARQDGDNMVRDIIRKLQDAQTVLKERFGKDWLEKDLRRLIEEHISSVNRKPGAPCELAPTVKQYLERKYEWVTWWVGLTKRWIPIRSADDHYMQMQIGSETDAPYLLVLWTEMPDKTPPHGHEEICNGKDSVQAWKTEPAYLVTNQKGCYDNFVRVDATPQDFLINCESLQTKPPLFAYYHFSDGSMKKITPNIQFNHLYLDRLLENGLSKPMHLVDGGLFFFYYKNRLMPNTFECRAITNDLRSYTGQVNVARSANCSSVAFKGVVTSLTDHLIRDAQQHNPTYLKMKKNELGALRTALEKWFNEKYSEFMWTVSMGVSNKMALAGCLESNNCISDTFVDSNNVKIPVVVSYSPKCNFEKQLKAAKRILSWMSNGPMETLFHAPESISLFLQDPRAYIYGHSSKVNTKGLKQKDMAALTNWKKVIFVNEGQDKDKAILQKYTMVKHTKRIAKDFSVANQHYLVVLDFYADYDDGDLCKVIGR